MSDETPTITPEIADHAAFLARKRIMDLIPPMAGLAADHEFQGLIDAAKEEVRFLARNALLPPEG